MRRRILVVEDNLPNQELLCDWLEAEGYETVKAPGLEQAFAALKSDHFHAVLLDVQLGPEDGLSLAASIRRQPQLRHLPVIAVTAHAMVTDHARVIQAGCNACISKPIDFKSLAKQLELWLDYTSKSESSRE
ncbi:MAG TPA: response regulator [Candidatus Limnocylindrales bacterium]|nr:response regulator [Candidatus Limnocylindrales bacterium]